MNSRYWLGVLLLAVLVAGCSADDKHDELSQAIAKPIEKAGAVEQALLDSEAQRKKEMEAQGL